MSHEYKRSTTASRRRANEPKYIHMSAYAVASPRKGNEDAVKLVTLNGTYKKTLTEEQKHAM